MILSVHAKLIVFINQHAQMFTSRHLFHTRQLPFWDFRRKVLRSDIKEFVGTSTRISLSDLISMIYESLITVIDFQHGHD